jgi:NAD(P)H-dependent flavin oxidoreductase YrpB (nitropropane dioxygenase family)
MRFDFQVSMEVVAIENKGNAQFEDIKHLVSGARGKKVFEGGDLDAGVWTAGQVVGLIDDIPTCEVLCSRMVSEAEAIILDRASLIKSKL